MKQKPTDEEILEMENITAKTAAAYLGMDNSKVYNGLQAGAFPFGTAYNTGKEWVYDIRPQALVEYNRHGKRDLMEQTVRFIVEAVGRHIPDFKMKDINIGA